MIYANGRKKSRGKSDKLQRNNKEHNIGENDDST